MVVHKTFQGLSVRIYWKQKIDHKSEAFFIRNVYKICFYYVSS